MGAIPSVAALERWMLIDQDLHTSRKNRSAYLLSLEESKPRVALTHGQ